jgi:arylsulfatase A-like enzyme
LPQTPAQNRRSLILVTVDCLRADHCGMYGYKRPTTPFLDSLASESFVVPKAIVAGAPTYYSFPAILASRMPLALGRDVIGLAPGESTLATTLHDSGYATGAFAAANPYLSARFGYEQGFDVFHDFSNFGGGRARQGVEDPLSSEPATSNSTRSALNQTIKSLSHALGLGGVYNELYFRYCMKIAPPAESMEACRSFPSADVLIDQAQSWLASIGDRPFFLWLHLMDPHSPYYPPLEAFRALHGEDITPDRARYLNEYWKRSDLTSSGLQGRKDEVVQLYDGGIRWVDQQIARLVDGLKQTKQWEDCVLALTADHGEEFLEHGGRYHAPVNLGEEIVHVPLLIRVPGERAQNISNSPMSHLHLAPTLLDLVGVKAPKTFQGRSMGANFRNGTAWDDPAVIECAYGCKNPFRIEGRIAPRLLGIRGSRFKLVMQMESGAIEEFYDLATDPAELNVLDGAALPFRNELLKVARRYLEKASAGVDADLRLRARLRDLRCQMLESAASTKMNPPQS